MRNKLSTSQLGWVLALTGLTLYILEQTQLLDLPPLLRWLPALWNDSQPDLRENHDLYALLFVVGALLAACSRERYEDEYIGQLRLEALLGALYMYCGLLVLAILLVSGMGFLRVMMYAMFAPLLLFLGLFQLSLRRAQRTTPAHD
ncbi:hypothetical protein [Hymenobacter lapidiphilus]|uniref:Uncharacterized protein n=1 Tax=Hymenobacter lapidiphilus TaxID=2608003 RepID=A0A7Y7U5D3_9BACT|nr:hypothetical protein [Hymenobacter lapidiphilus]NVO30629.1 hypothetical protein [Hymenobacter lapidiphilus]